MTEELAAAPELKLSLRRSAMNALGRREQSVFELKQKLSQRYEEANEEEITEVIHRLTNQGLQSDDRFAEMFVRSRINKGKGPNLIRRELEQQNLPSAMLEQAFRKNPCNWQQSALQQLQKKYSVIDMQEFALRAKATQFLYRRGFDSDTCSKAVDALKTQTKAHSK